jgi:hypothetical protein
LTLREEALRIRKAKLGPDNSDTLMTTWAVATSLVALDRDEEATPLVEDCLKRAAGKAVDSRLVPELLRLRLRLFAKRKDVANCVAIAQRLDDLKSPGAHSLLMSARCRALCAAVIKEGSAGPANADQLALEQANLAMAWLTKAIDAGVVVDAWFKREKDLDPLRDRPDFKKLVAETEARFKRPANKEPRPK